AGANGPTVGQLMHGNAPMHPSDLEDDLNLIRRVVGRDRQAFEPLYHRFSPVVYRYLWKLIRQPEIVEEALNDVMMVVWQTASRFKWNLAPLNLDPGHCSLQGAQGAGTVC